MEVGDLVRFRGDPEIGVIVGFKSRHYGQIYVWFPSVTMTGPDWTWDTSLELINEAR